MVTWIIRQPISLPLHVYKLRSRTSQSSTLHFTIHLISHKVSCSHLLTAPSTLTVPEKPPPTLNATNTTFPPCSTTARPYLSLGGARKNGPSASANKKMETCSAPTVVSVMCRSDMTRWSEGAKIVEAKGERKEKAATMAVARNFFGVGQDYVVGCSVGDEGEIV
jgi:hypothetical protein